jgi:hypothetical protein
MFSREIMSLTKYSMQPTLHCRNLLCETFLQFGSTILTILTLQIYYKLCKMYPYWNDEKTDMILVNGECLKNASFAAHAQRYPERRACSDMIFRILKDQLRANN